MKPANALCRLLVAGLRTLISFTPLAPLSLAAPALLWLVVGQLAKRVRRPLAE